MKHSSVFLPFALGWGSVLAQMVLLREMFGIFSGQEFFLSVALAIWLLGSGVGSAAGSWIFSSEKKRDFLWIFFLLLTMASVVVSIALVRLCRIFFQVLPGEPLSINHLAILSALSLGLVAFLWGIQFSFSIQILSAQRKNTSAIVYCVESLGSLLGGLLFAFVFVRFPMYLLVLLLFLPLLEAGRRGCDFLQNTSRPLRIFSTSLLLLFLLGSTWILYQKDGQWEKEKWDSLFQNPLQLKESAFTPFGQIAHLSLGDQQYLYSSGFPYLTFPDAERGLQRAHLLLNQHPGPEKVLMVGGGFLGLSEMVLYPLKEIDCVELDSDLMDRAKNLASPQDRQALENQKVKIFYQDGRTFVKNTSAQKYDLVLLFLPPPATIALNRYYTLEFFQEIQRVLKPEGALILPLSASLSMHLPGALAQRNKLIYQTLAVVFQDIKILPGSVHLFLCSNQSSSTTLEVEKIAHRILEKKIPLPFLKIAAEEKDGKGDSDFLSESLLALLESWVHPRHIYETMMVYRGEEKEKAEKKEKAPLLPWQKKKREKEELLELYKVPAFKGSTPINRDFRPLAVLYHLKAMEYEEQKKILPAWMEEISWNNVGWTVGGGLLAVLVGGLSINGLLRRKKRGIAEIALVTTGFWGMGMEMILMLSFQSHHGYIYSALGFFTGIFMAGLAVGSYVGISLWKKLSPQTGLKLLILGCSGYGILLSFLLPFLSQIWMYGIFNGLVGCLLGILYSCSVEILLRQGWSESRAGGMAYSLDLIGSATAALFTNILLVCHLGVGGTIWIFSGLLFFPLAYSLLLESFLYKKTE